MTPRQGIGEIARFPRRARACRNKGWRGEARRRRPRMCGRKRRPSRDAGRAWQARIRVVASVAVETIWRRWRRDRTRRRQRCPNIGSAARFATAASARAGAGSHRDVARSAGPGVGAGEMGASARADQQKAARCRPGQGAGCKADAAAAPGVIAALEDRRARRFRRRKQKIVHAGQPARRVAGTTLAIFTPTWRSLQAGISSSAFARRVLAKACDDEGAVAPNGSGRDPLHQGRFEGFRDRRRRISASGDQASGGGATCAVARSRRASAELGLALDGLTSARVSADAAGRRGTRPARQRSRWPARPARTDKAAPRSPTAATRSATTGARWKSRKRPRSRRGKPRASEQPANSGPPWLCGSPCGRETLSPAVQLVAKLFASFEVGMNFSAT